LEILQFPSLILTICNNTDFQIVSFGKQNTTGETSMLRAVLSKIPMKLSVPLLLTAPVFVAVVVLSAIAFGDAKSAANDLMEQNLSQIHNYIKERLNDLLALPNRIQRVNANLILKEWLKIKDLRAWQEMLLEQAQTFKGLSSITWGGADGGSVGIARNPTESGYRFSIKNNQTDKNLKTYYIDAQGRMEKEPREQLPYDPRKRPWYKAAIEAGQPTWTNPYARMYNGASRAKLAMGYVQSFHNNNGQIIGVMNAELTMDDITLFLEKLSIGRTGKAFIIDYEGRLIASSTGVPLIDAGNFPVIASVAADRDIAAAAEHIEKTLGAYSAIDARYQLSLMINQTPHLLMVSPSYHKTGLNWVIATLVPESDFLDEIQAGRQRSIRIGVLVVCITLLLGIVMAAISLWPMLDLARYVQSVGEGNLENELHLEYSTEFVKLSKQINAMTAGLRDRLRLRQSLALAQEVQQNLLPSDTTKIDRLDIIGHATYCDETGGDYFDFLDIKGLPETTAAIAVGDVAGHGVPAAMLMATARGILQSRCREPGSLADLLAHLNNLLVGGTGGDGFMSMLLMTVDAARKEMRWATAGHEVPVIYDPQSDKFIELKGTGMVLGLKTNNTYTEEKFTDVRSGQIYLSLTDGLWETFNKEGDMFGMERVHELIRSYAHLSAAEISEKIIDEVTRFRGQERPEDDLTFVIVKVL
jgi:serine phosphatase RsbU (regulator of sigma subunit)